MVSLQGKAEEGKRYKMWPLLMAFERVRLVIRFTW